MYAPLATVDPEIVGVGRPACQHVRDVEVELLLRRTVRAGEPSVQPLAEQRTAQREQLPVPSADRDVDPATGQCVQQHRPVHRARRQPCLPRGQQVRRFGHRYAGNWMDGSSGSATS